MKNEYRNTLFFILLWQEVRLKDSKNMNMSMLMKKYLKIDNLKATFAL